MVGLNSVGPCWCWKLGKCCRTFLVEATRPQVLSLSFFFPPLAIPPLDFHSKAKLVALSQSIWMPPSMGVCKVHQFHPPKQFKLYFATPAQLLQHRAVSLCRAPTSAKIAFLEQPLDFYTNTSRTPLGSCRTRSGFPLHEEIGTRELFPWSLGWFGICFTQTL